MTGEFKAPTPEELAAYMKSDEYKRAVAEAASKMETDDAIVEIASWFGTTGLPEDVERELSRYLRREFGESLSEDPNALKASDLMYVGAYDEADGRAHYWQVPCASENAVYAYVVVNGNRIYTGWSGRNPPSGDA